LGCGADSPCIWLPLFANAWAAVNSCIRRQEDREFYGLNGVEFSDSAIALIGFLWGRTKWSSIERIISVRLISKLWDKSDQMTLLA
jgi:hypothetical protein